MAQIVFETARKRKNYPPTVIERLMFLSCNQKHTLLLCSSDDESDVTCDDYDIEEEFDLFDLFSIFSAFSRNRSFNQ